MTTKKSNIFHPDKKYDLPNALSFKTISPMNIMLKAKFMFVNTFDLKLLSSSYADIMTAIFPKIQKIIPYSKALHVTIL